MTFLAECGADIFISNKSLYCMYVRFGGIRNTKTRSRSIQNQILHIKQKGLEKVYPILCYSVGFCVCNKDKCLP